MSAFDFPIALPPRASATGEREFGASPLEVRDAATVSRASARVVRPSCNRDLALAATTGRRR